MLEATDVVGGYGDIRVLWGVSVTAEAGAVTVVLGRNGTGKTSLLKAIAGFLPTFESGRVLLGGTELSRVPPYGRTRAGLGFVQEGKRIFRRRSVEENLLVGAYTVKRPLFGPGAAVRAALEQAYGRFPVLAERRKSPAGSLSGGQQQMLAIAQALMAGPRALLLDEPSAGLAPGVAREVFSMVAALKGEGLAILLVEQVVEQALGIADRVVVLDNGRVAASGLAAEFDDAAVVRDVYLGRHDRMVSGDGSSGGPAVG